MKNKIYFCLTLTFLAVFAISCSQSEDLIPAVEEIPETRADSPLLVVSPTELYFENAIEYISDTKNVNIKTAGLSSLAVLTNFDVTIQGPNSSAFSVEDFEPSLTGILQALLGGGFDILVTFTPNNPGTYEAELLITATLLGVLMPVQITVPLHGSTAEIPIPKLLYTIPENGGTVEWESRVPDSEYGQYYIDFVFDMDIRIINPPYIQFAYTTTAIITGLSVVNGNTLRVRVWEDPARLTNLLIVQPNAVISSSTFSSVGNEKISLTYTVTGDIPD